MDASSLNFIDLTITNITFLIFVGFVGGLVSGAAIILHVLVKGMREHGAQHEVLEQTAVTD